MSDKVQHSDTYLNIRGLVRLGVGLILTFALFEGVGLLNIVVNGWQ